MTVVSMPRVYREDAWTVDHRILKMRTPGPMSFVDVTERVARTVAQAGIRFGHVNVQSQHTTAALVVNENEPLLLEDLRRTLEAFAPRERVYEHDDFSRRKGPLPADEPVNGHSHCKALMLPSSATLNIVDGRLDLGRWQSLFLVELDSARDRQISLMVVGIR